MNDAWRSIPDGKPINGVHAHPDWHTWLPSLEKIIANPAKPGTCPSCGKQAIITAWNLLDAESRSAAVRAACTGCRRHTWGTLVLPAGLPDVFATGNEQLSKESARIAEMVRQAQAAAAQLPVTRFTSNPLWDRAVWSGTSFKWHPISEHPPIMGLCFRDEKAGAEIFLRWVKECGNEDTLEEIRICIVEGEVPGQKPGYTIHISPDPENTKVHATAEGIAFANNPLVMLGRVSRMHPAAGSAALLPRFKEEFERHGEYLLAPAVRRADGKLYMDVELGIVKTIVHFRNAAEIGEEDIDAIALVPRAAARVLGGALAPDCGGHENGE